jgi:hypothetical protein
MTEAGQTGAENRRTSPLVDDIVNGFRAGLECLADAFTPPESACSHFREARIEMLRGFRDIIDHRIDRLSRKNNPGAKTGTTVVVE